MLSISGNHNTNYYSRLFVELPHVDNCAQRYPCFGVRNPQKEEKERKKPPAEAGGVGSTGRFRLRQFLLLPRLPGHALHGP